MLDDWRTRSHALIALVGNLESLQQAIRDGGAGGRGRRARRVCLQNSFLMVAKMKTWMVSLFVWLWMSLVLSYSHLLYNPDHILTFSKHMRNGSKTLCRGTIGPTIKLIVLQHGLWYLLSATLNLMAPVCSWLWTCPPHSGTLASFCLDCFYLCYF